MSQWLKRRLIALFAIAFSISGASYLSAQNDYPAPAKTPEEAGEKFFEVLSKGALYSFNFEFDSRMQQPELLGSISRSQMTSLRKLKKSEGHQILLSVLATEAYERTFKGKVIKDEKEKAVVEVLPGFKPKEVVCIQEDGGWRVDMFATYGKWANVSGAELDEEIYKMTGLTTPLVLSSPNFLRSQCQTQLKQVMYATKQYMQDWNDKMPPARRWSDVLDPYTKDRAIFNCPALPVGKTNGYAFNQNLSQISELRIDNWAETVTIYETSNLGLNVFGPGTGRAFRHSDGTLVAFADGRIGWRSRAKSAKLRFKP